MRQTEHPSCTSGAIGLIMDGDAADALGAAKPRRDVTCRGRQADGLQTGLALEEITGGGVNAAEGELQGAAGIRLARLRGTGGPIRKRPSRRIRHRRHGQQNRAAEDGTHSAHAHLPQDGWLHDHDLGIISAVGRRITSRVKPL